MQVYGPFEIVVRFAQNGDFHELTELFRRSRTRALRREAMLALSGVMHLGQVHEKRLAAELIREATSDADTLLAREAQWLLDTPFSPYAVMNWPPQKRQEP